MRKQVLGTMLLALSACGSSDNTAATEYAAGAAATAAASPTAAASATAATAALAAAPASFASCKACHAVEPGKHGIGPSLHGVHGTKSGAIAGYAFSAPMKQADLTWDDATLDAYLEAPAKVVPGTKMTYAGLKDPAKRAEIIAYMKSLK